MPALDNRLIFYCRGFLLFVVVACLQAQAVFAQIGPRPGTTRRNYPLGGLGMPRPDLPEVNYKGKIEKLDDKMVLVKLDDGRTANFERTHRTKFYKNAKEVKSSELKVGDRVSIDAELDPQAFLTALRVSFDTSPVPELANTSTTEAGRNFPSSIGTDANGRPTLMRRSSEEAETESGQGENPNGRPSLLRRDAKGAERNTEEGTQPSAPGPTPGVKNGRPSLLRRDSERMDEIPGESGNGADGGTGIPEIPMPSARSGVTSGHLQDALIEKARAAALPPQAGLPKLICEEIMVRSTRDQNATGWQPLDTVSAETTYAGGEETHNLIKIGNQPADQQALSGSWPIGRLLGTLNDLLAPETEARFVPGGDTNLFDLQARIYDFDVTQEHSHWTMRMGSETINAAYRGTMWVDKASGRVLRLEMQAHDLPVEFPLERLETNVEYASIRIGENPVILPTHVETMGCQRDSHACSQSVIDFRAYRQ